MSNSWLENAPTHSQPLMAAGLDSLGAVDLRSALSQQLDMQLPATIVFDYPSITAIANYVHSNSPGRRSSHSEVRILALRRELNMPCMHASACCWREVCGVSACVRAWMSMAPAGTSQGAHSMQAVDDSRISQQVRAAVYLLLGQQVQDDQPLVEAGLDSLGAVELRSSLAGSLNTDLPGTVVFDYPTIAALSAFLQLELASTAMAQRGAVSNSIFCCNICSTAHRLLAMYVVGMYICECSSCIAQGSQLACSAP